MKGKSLTRKLPYSAGKKHSYKDAASATYAIQPQDNVAFSPHTASSLQHTLSSSISPDPRPRSSIYSQPSVIYSPTFTNPWSTLNSPSGLNVNTTQCLPTGESQARATPVLNKRYGVQDQCTDADEQHRHTAISEYISVRSWMEDKETSPSARRSPTDSNANPIYFLWDNITGNIRRKSSIFSSSLRHGVSIVNPDSDSSRRTSSTATTRTSASSTSRKVGTNLQDQIRVYINELRPASSKDDIEKDAHESQRPYLASAPKISATTASKTNGTTTATRDQQPSLHPPRRAALFHNIGQAHGSNSVANPKSGHNPPSLPMSHPQQQKHQYSSQSIFKPSLWSTEPIRAPEHRYQPIPPRPNSKILVSLTKSPKCCDQGKYLGIGTMRAMSPAEIDMLQGWMLVSMCKLGDTERGVKEVKKWLRYQDRATVEWVAEWLYHRWGCEL